MSSFAITAASETVVLEPVKGEGNGPPSYRGQVAYTITNTTDRPVTALVSVAPQGQAAPEWFALMGPATIALPAQGSAQTTLQITCPPGTAAGSYSGTIVVRSEVAPDEDSTGQPVGFQVPAGTAKKPFPWWILAVAAIVVIGGVVVWRVLAGGDDGADGCLGMEPTITGTEADDILNGTPGADVILALGGNDMVDGAGGDDVICGGAGDDRLNGGLGRDRLDGGVGNDAVEGHGGDDVLEGGEGDDFVDGGVGGCCDPQPNTGDDQLSGGPGNDDLWSSDFGTVVIDGGDGNDHLHGLFGDDTLNGGAGDDIVDAGPGMNQVDGGEGTDICHPNPMDVTTGCEGM